MKRGRVSIVLVAGLLVMALLLSACSKPAPTATPAPAPKTTAPAAAKTTAPAAAKTTAPAAKTTAPAPAAEKLPQHFILADTGAGNMPAMRAYLSEMITKYTPMRGAIEKTTGIEQCVEMVAKGDAQLTVFSPPGVVIAANKKKLRVLSLFSGGGLPASTTLGIFTKPGAGINSIKDFKGKKVYVDKPAMGWCEPVMDAWLKVNNMARTDFTYLKYAEADDCFRDLKEGRVDAFFYIAGAGTVEMAKATGLFVVPLTPQEQQAAVDLGLGYISMVWPAGVSGNTKDTPTVAAPAVFFTGPQLSENAAYTVTKMFYDHIAEFKASQKANEQFDLKNALDVWAFPYQAGAIKFFKEKGIWTAEHDKKQQQVVDSWKKTLGG